MKKLRMLFIPLLVLGCDGGSGRNGNPNCLAAARSSCEGLAALCAGSDCCASEVLPAGSFYDGDGYSDQSYPAPCVDCGHLTPGAQRVVRGGAFGGSPDDIKASVRTSFSSDTKAPFIGFRCVTECG